MHLARNHTVLLTGFGPFPGVRRNASADLVRRLERHSLRTVRATRLCAAVLTTEWATVGEQIGALLARHRPSVAVHFGVSSRAIGFELETTARNEAMVRQDVVGCLNENQRLIADARLSLKTTLPAASAVNALRARGIRAKLSRDAGGYLCNAVYYHSLRLSKQLRVGHKAIFVHLPTSLRKQAPLTGRHEFLHGMSEVEALQGAACLIEHFAGRKT